MVELLCKLPDTSVSDGISLGLKIWGNSDPRIRDVETYRWKLDLQGNNQFSYIKALTIYFSFKNGTEDTDCIQVVNFEPISENIPQGSIEFYTPVHQIASYSRNIEKEKIIANESENGVKWIFRDIRLAKDPSFKCTISGKIDAIFADNSYDKEFKISMDITPEFHKKQYYGLRSEIHPHSPRIKYDKVMECCKVIRTNYLGVKKDESEDKLLDYRFDKEMGILYKGDVRNVSLRCETLARLFTKIRNEKNGVQILKIAGKEIGKNFFSKFSSEILMKDLTPEEKIKRWIEYDASAGMGRFEVEGKTIIRVHNSFNVCECYQEKKPICHFLEGYFEGVLCQLYGDNISVKEISCAAAGGVGGDYCVFSISQKKKKK